MKIYSLTGPSGTGKSYQAPLLMAEKNMDILVDDGLLISAESVEAGISAKRQKTKIGAVKTALFSDEEHAESVRKRLRELEAESNKPLSLLIVGTSDKMADRIAERLELPPISERFYIDDITTPKDRAKAEKAREHEGKHVIPVPTLQLKRDFAGYFMNPEKLIRQAKEQTRDMTGKAKDVIRHPGSLLHRGGKNSPWSKTVVRPTYSYLGDFLINEKVIKDIAECVGKEIRGIRKIVSVYENSSPDQMKIVVVLDMDRETEIWKTGEEFQKRMMEVVERMTAFNVVETDIEVRSLI